MVVGQPSHRHHTSHNLTPSSHLTHNLTPRHTSHPPASPAYSCMSARRLSGSRPTMRPTRYSRSAPATAAEAGTRRAGVVGGGGRKEGMGEVREGPGGGERSYRADPAAGAGRSIILRKAPLHPPPRRPSPAPAGPTSHPPARAAPVVPAAAAGEARRRRCGSAPAARPGGGRWCGRMRGGGGTAGQHDYAAQCRAQLQVAASEAAAQGWRHTPRAQCRSRQR